MTLIKNIEVSDGDVKHYIRESCDVVNIEFGEIGLMLARRELGNTLKQKNLGGNSFFSKVDFLQILSETASSFSLQYEKGRKF